MDLDLFSAFDGDQKVGNVVESKDPEKANSPSQLRKRSREEDAVTASDEEVKQVQLVHGEESSTVRDDGTFVKSYSVYPSDWKADPHYRPSAKPAKEYPFILDPFQKQAIQYIERNESVLVSAHTSAGKTVNAEYAIAKCLRDKQRVIYTSPIKALSNQKFRDLQEEFGDVGLMTGDITINPSATCLIMTTEILRSMLYRGSEVMREVAWVIYDEIHYMRDKSRGVVWEESIILLPHKVRFVFLSATIPNSKEFCGWIAKTHHQPCHVVYTDYRPVPLEHYIFPAGGDGLHLVVDDKGRFRENSFQRAMATLQATPEEQAVAEGKKLSGAKKQTGKKDGEGSDLYKIVKLVMDRSLDPAIIFSFAKKECEANALQMSKLDFNDDSQRSLVEQVFNNAMASLSEEDRHLPQVVEAILPLLKRGVGIHHGGLLPILKEVIEILFQARTSYLEEGLIKVLFATETFSIGLNMPARTVVFTNTRKFDGKDFRWITSGEYIQMSGRAGRRGKDDKGIVIQMLDEKMDPQVAKGILYGDADALNSSYHISYNMLLNMLRVEGADPQYLVKSSFHQYQQEAAAPALENQARILEEEIANCAIKGEGDEKISEYFLVQQQLQRTQEEVLKTVQRPENCIPFIQGGRIVRMRGSPISRWHVQSTGEDLMGTENGHGIDGGENGGTKVLKASENFDWDWGAVVNLQKTSKAGEPSQYCVDVLVMCETTGDGVTEVGKEITSRPFPIGKGEMRVLAFNIKSTVQWSAVRITMPTNLRPIENRTAVAQSIKEIIRRFKDEVPLIHPVTDMGIQDPAFNTLLAREDQLKKRLKDMPFHKDGNRYEHLQRYQHRLDLGDRVKLLRKEVKGVQHMVMRDEMRRMKRVLRRLGHCDGDGVIQLKGRVACEINTCDELVVTELIFNGVFNELSEEQSTALLSCMVFQAKQDENLTLPPELQGPFRQLQDAARHIARVAEDSKITIEAEEYVNSFTPTMMEVAFAWSNGAKFKDVIELTDVFEGSVIRVIRRLEELLRQLSQASGSIGNMELKTKFEQAANKIRRDIVFAASLYL
ncbi:unnamed protein product [Choristocarpus tenellus]